MLGIDPNLIKRRLYIRNVTLSGETAVCEGAWCYLYPTDADLKVFEMPHNSEGQAFWRVLQAWVQCSRSRNHRCLALSYSSPNLFYEFIQANYSTHYSLPTLSLDTLARPLEALERGRVGSSLF